MNVEKGGSIESGREGQDGPPVKFFQRPWMKEYNRWYRERFEHEPPKIQEAVDPKTGDTVFHVKMAYTTHIRPTENLLLSIQDIKSGLPREDYFDVEISDNKKNQLKTSYLENVPDTLADSSFLVEGANLTVCIRKGPSDEFKRKAGWVISNVLGDPAFAYEWGMPLVNERRRSLLKVINKP